MLARSSGSGSGSGRGGGRGVDAAATPTTKQKQKQVTLRLLFANHEDVKPLELKNVPLSASIGEVKALLRAAWPAGSLPTGMADTPATTAAGAAPEQQQRWPKRRRASASGPSPSAAAPEPEPPQTPLSVASTVSPVVGTAAATAATDDLEEQELGEKEEDDNRMRTPPFRLICLGRGWEDDGKTLKDYHVQVFEDHPTPVQVAIRPGGALGPAASGKARQPPKALDGDEGEEAGARGRRAEGDQDELGSLVACCGCGIM